jgi:hypothetical protein
MSTYRLEKLFFVTLRCGGERMSARDLTRPLKNLRSAGFKGSISLVNRHYPEIAIGQNRPGTDRGAGSARHCGAGAFGARHRRGIGRQRGATAVVITAGLGDEHGIVAAHDRVAVALLAPWP